MLKNHAKPPFEVGSRRKWRFATRRRSRQGLPLQPGFVLSSSRDFGRIWHHQHRTHLFTASRFSRSHWKDHTSDGNDRRLPASSSLYLTSKNSSFRPLCAVNPLGGISTGRPNYHNQISPYPYLGQWLQPLYRQEKDLKRSRLPCTAPQYSSLWWLFYTIVLGVHVIFQVHVMPPARQREEDQETSSQETDSSSYQEAESSVD
jgi:hypothetical protein